MTDHPLLLLFVERGISLIRGSKVAHDMPENQAAIIADASNHFRGIFQLYAESVHPTTDLEPDRYIIRKLSFCTIFQLLRVMNRKLNMML